MGVDINSGPAFSGPAFSGAPLLSLTGYNHTETYSSAVVVPAVFCQILLHYALNKPNSHPKYLLPNSFSIKGVLIYDLLVKKIWFIQSIMEKHLTKNREHQNQVFV